MIVEHEYDIKLSEIGKTNKMTNKAILGCLEDIGGIHSNIAGNGILDIPRTHLTWVLLDWKLKIIRRPSYTEKIKIKTWSRRTIKCYSYRDFEIYDLQGMLIGIATSKWVLVNIETGRIEKVEDSLISKYKPETGKTVFVEEDIEKIREPEQYLSETEYQAKRIDIDVNNHMHNLNYIELAVEALPEEIYQKEEFNNVRITYKKEIKLGETVKCKYTYQNEKHIVSIKSEDDKVLHAIIQLN